MKKAIWAAVIIVVIVILGIWMGNKGKVTENNSAAVQKPMKIGAILPLTGPVASAGEATKHGIEKALIDLAKDGKKPNVEVFFEDGQYDSKASISAYNKLKNEGVDAFMVFGTPSVMPLVPLVNADHKPLMALLLAPVYSTPDDYTFRMVASGVTTAQYAADMLNDLGKKKIAVMYANNDYGIGGLKSFKEFVGTRATIVAEENAAPGVTDYRTQVTKIKKANPDAVFMLMTYKEAGLFIKQAKEIGLNVTFLGDQPVDSPDFIATAGAAAEGAIVISPTAASNDTFSQEYTAAYTLPPSYLSVKTYDSVKVFNAIAEKCAAKNYTGECIKDELYAIKDFPGLSFPINYDKNGDINDQLIVRTVKDGKFIPYVKP